MLPELASPGPLRGMRVGHPAAHCTDSDVGAARPAAMAVGAVGEAQWTVASGFLGVNAVPSAGGAAPR